MFLNNNLPPETGREEGLPTQKQGDLTYLVPPKKKFGPGV
jgi:hypothetical protein